MSKHGKYLRNPVVWESELNLAPVSAKRMAKYNAELLNRQEQMARTDVIMRGKARRNGIDMADCEVRNASRNPSWKTRPRRIDVDAYDREFPGYMGYLMSVRKGRIGTG